MKRFVRLLLTSIFFLTLAFAQANWNAATSYSTGARVTFSTHLYMATAPSHGANPAQRRDVWQDLGTITPGPQPPVGSVTVTCSGSGLVITSSSLPQIAACANYSLFSSTQNFDLLSPITGDYTLIDSLIVSGTDGGNGSTAVIYDVTWVDEQGSESTFANTNLTWSPTGPNIFMKGVMSAMNPAAMNVAAGNGQIQPGTSPLQIHAIAGNPIHVNITTTGVGVGTFTIVSGGTGWNVGDGGTIQSGNQDAHFSVTSVDAPDGAVTGISFPFGRGSFYSPGGPVNCPRTSGAGTGFQITILTNNVPGAVFSYHATLMRNQ